MEPVIRLALVVVVGSLAGAAAGGTVAWGLWVLLWAPYGGTR